jgi:hypothetical protein
MDQWERFMDQQLEVAKFNATQRAQQQAAFNAYMRDLAQYNQDQVLDAGERLDMINKIHGRGEYADEEGADTKIVQSAGSSTTDDEQQLWGDAAVQPPDPFEFAALREQMEAALNPPTEQVELGGETALDDAVSKALQQAAAVKGRRFAAEYLAVTEALADPHLPENKKVALRAQFSLRHPEAGNLRPLTPEQRAELKQQQRLAEEEARTGTPMAFDEKGRLVVHPGYTAAREREKEMQALEQKEIAEKRQAAVELTKLKAKRIGNRPSRSDYKNDLGTVNEQAYSRDLAAWERQLDAQIAETEAAFGLRQGVPSLDITNDARSVRPDAPASVVELADADELADGLAARKWKPGTVLSLGGYTARVAADGMSVEEIQ